ncbi:hypothetical protein C2I18_19500 [Paenibacillus sp. PK3_47]|nr:hypothetical protein C2I18_19500 [Paenibacillus sp. PK3_47]
MELLLPASIMTRSGPRQIDKYYLDCIKQLAAGEGKQTGATVFSTRIFERSTSTLICPFPALSFTTCAFFRSLLAHLKIGCLLIAAVIYDRFLTENRAGIIPFRTKRCGSGISSSSCTGSLKRKDWDMSETSMLSILPLNPDTARGGSRLKPQTLHPAVSAVDRHRLFRLSAAQTDRTGLPAAAERRQIEMIAKSTGYRDPTHFRQGFRKIMGTSPSDYRKSGQQKQT